MINNSDFLFLKKCLNFLSEISKTDKDLLISSCKMRATPKGTVIMNDRSECSGLIIVKSGQLRAFLRGESGKEITLYRLLPGDVCILTASCVLNNITFDVTMESEKNSVIYMIPSSLFARLCENYNAAKEFSMSLLNERFSSVMFVVEQMVSKNMGQRVAAFLLEEQTLEKSKQLTLTHETIANNLGTAREVISRVLKYLENEGLISLSRGKITILEPERLAKL